jgi:hypothetical protein
MVNPFDIKAALFAKHAQHVVLIHFPIALFITAVAFDLIAQWTKRRGVADAAYYNLLVAAISTLPVLATGLDGALGRILEWCESSWVGSSGESPLSRRPGVSDRSSIFAGIKATRASY